MECLLGLHPADLCRVKSPLSDGRPLHHEQFRRLDLGLTVGGLQLVLELTDPP